MATIKWSKDRVRKILIIKMRYIGDTVLVTPLISALKKALPLAEMHLLTHRDTAPVVKGHAEIDNLLAFDYIHAKKNLLYFMKFVLKLKKLKFDMVIDLTRNDRSALLTALTGAVWRIGYDGAPLFQKMAYTHKVPFRLGKIHMVDHHLQIASHLGLPVDDIHPNLTVSRREIRDIRHRLDGAGLDAKRPYVLIHPGARRWYKSWPADRFARIADAILEHIRQLFTDAYARLTAMRLFSSRAADYMRSATASDRRYLLYNSLVKMKVTTQGETVINLLWDVIAAKGFEKDVYFQNAAQDIRALPKLEGTVHVNMALIVKFMANYLFNPGEFPEISRRLDPVDDTRKRTGENPVSRLQRSLRKCGSSQHCHIQGTDRGVEGISPDCRTERPAGPGYRFSVEPRRTLHPGGLRPSDHRKI